MHYGQRIPVKVIFAVILLRGSLSLVFFLRCAHTYDLYMSFHKVGLQEKQVKCQCTVAKIIFSIIVLSVVQ